MNKIDAGMDDLTKKVLEFWDDWNYIALAGFILALIVGGLYLWAR